MNVEANEGKELVGQFFHSYAESGEYQHQGFILSSPEPGYYLCQLFEWFTGSQSSRKLFRIADMADWTFYASAEGMAENYQYTKYR